MVSLRTAGACAITTCAPHVLHSKAAPVHVRHAVSNTQLRRAAAKPKPVAKPVAPVRPAGFRTAMVAPTTLFQKKNPSPVVTAKAPKPASTGKLTERPSKEG